MIYFDKVSKIYLDQSVALNDVSFTIEPGQFTSVVGHSGAGKSTLLKMIIAEERPSAGKVFFDCPTPFFDSPTVEERGSCNCRRTVRAGVTVEELRN